MFGKKQKFAPLQKEKWNQICIGHPGCCLTARSGWGRAITEQPRVRIVPVYVKWNVKITKAIWSWMCVIRGFIGFVHIAWHWAQLTRSVPAADACVTGPNQREAIIRHRSRALQAEPAGATCAHTKTASRSHTHARTHRHKKKRHSPTHFLCASSKTAYLVAVLFGRKYGSSDFSYVSQTLRVGGRQQQCTCVHVRTLIHVFFFFSHQFLIFFSNRFRTVKRLTSNEWFFATSLSLVTIWY